MTNVLTTVSDFNDATEVARKSVINPYHHSGHAADVTAQFLRDLGHPTTVIINRRGADQKPLWLKDAPW